MLDKKKPETKSPTLRFHSKELQTPVPDLVTDIRSTHTSGGGRFPHPSWLEERLPNSKTFLCMQLLLEKKAILGVVSNFFDSFNLQWFYWDPVSSQNQRKILSLYVFSSVPRLFSSLGAEINLTVPMSRSLLWGWLSTHAFTYIFFKPSSWSPWPGQAAALPHLSQTLKCCIPNQLWRFESSCALGLHGLLGGAFERWLDDGVI